MEKDLLCRWMSFAFFPPDHRIAHSASSSLAEKAAADCFGRSKGSKLQDGGTTGAPCGGRQVKGVESWGAIKSPFCQIRSRWRVHPMHPLQRRKRFCCNHSMSTRTWGHHFHQSSLQQHGPPNTVQSRGSSAEQRWKKTKKEEQPEKKRKCWQSSLLQHCAATQNSRQPEMVPTKILENPTLHRCPSKLPPRNNSH